MSKTPINPDDFYLGTVNPVPRWLRINDAVKYSGFHRSVLYEYLRSGQIRSAHVQQSGTLRGARMIDRESLDQFMEAHVGLPPKRKKS